MLLPIVTCVMGLVVILFAFWKFGARHLLSNSFSRGWMVILAGVAIVAAGTKYGDYKWKHLDDRAVFERHLAERFHRAPDRLELEGSTLEDFRGTAYVDGKRYEVQSKITSANDREMKYDVMVTPVVPNP